MGAEPGPAAPALSSPPGAFLNKGSDGTFEVCKKWQVLEQPRVPVGSSVTLGLVTTGPGGSSARWASVTTRQGALEGGGDNLRGQVKVVPQVLNALVCKVPANRSLCFTGR